MFCCKGQCHTFEATQNQDRRQLKLAAYSTFIITFLLIICRAAAYFTTHSFAVEASIVDAIKDFLVSSVNAIFVLKSIKPADKSYPFGYGKVEAFAAFLQSLFLFGTGSFIVFDAIRGAASHHHSVSYSSVAITVLAISIILSVGLIIIQTYVAKCTKSLAVLADAAHYKSDVVFNIGIIICLFASFKSAWFDIIIGFAIAVYLLITACKIGFHSISILLDHSLPQKDIENIKNIVQESKGLVHSLRTHSTGRGEFIALELSEKKGTISDLQIKKQLIEEKIHHAYPRSFIIISWATENSAALED